MLSVSKETLADLVCMPRCGSSYLNMSGCEFMSSAHVLCFVYARSLARSTVG